MNRPVTREEQQRIDHQVAIRGAAAPLLPLLDPPYYAHMRLLTAKGERDVLLSSWARAGEGIWVLDWQQSPLSDVFFECSENEDYELELDGRVLNGRVLERNLVRFDGAGLCGLITPDGVLERGPGGAWLAKPPLAASLRSHSPFERTAVSAVDVVLDEKQRSVVDLPGGRSTLILGEAGCGKTTVALHRLAHLWKQQRVRMRAAVIVPTDALQRLVETLLERLAVPDVEVWKYDEWARQQARLAFGALPRRESQNATAGVVRIKRDPALKRVIEKVGALPPPSRKKGKATRRSDRVEREDLFHLFGDRALLEEVVAHSPHAIPRPAIDELLAHTKLQFRQTSEQQWAHVSAERLTTVDGKGMDEGTPDEDVQSIDVEDYAVLFELDRARAEALGERPVTPRPYEMIVIDEAQEFAGLELSLIGRSLARNGTLIVAGDAEQQVDPTASFESWDAAMGQLHAADYDRATLEVSYRCPPDVTALARRLRGDVQAQAPEQTPSVDQVRFDHESHLVAWMIDALRDLRGRAPGATVAVICRSAEQAIRLSRLVGRGVDARLALEGDFDFHSGLHVTCVPEVKGLEFDYVILPDASASSYPETVAARRALYVAVTRTTRRLVLASVGAPTPLLGGITPR